MKTTSLCVIAFVLISILSFNSNAFSQGPYVRASLGISLPLASYSVFDETFTSSSSNTNRKYDSRNLSFGKGIPVEIAPGYMLNKNIGAELGISYLVGLSTETTDKSTNSSGKTSTDINNFKGAMLAFTPSVVVESGMNKINPYARMGLIIGLPSFKIEENDTDYDGDQDITVEKYYSGLAFGFNSALGVLYQMSNKIGVFAELNMNALSYGPKKGKLLKYSHNGTDLLPDATTREKETEFLYDYETNSNNNPSDGEPSKEQGFKMPFSSFGLNLGIKMKF
ncbi:MAG: outer membrane beta-barrel protein [Bacteroidia bacterium]|nr:outer membrane beta-barrel protein [Bacteroidia bacterium]